MTFAASGAFTYRPNAGFTGADHFNVSASDGMHTVAATVTLTVTAVGPNPQTLSFTQAGPLSVFVGDTVSNAASAPGGGAVTYRSTDPSVVTVDDNGLATLVGVGTAEIIADKAADAHFLAAHSSYTVKSIERSVPFTSWLGTNDNLVSFPASAAGLAFYRSSEPECDLANFTSCADGQLDVLGTATVTDTAATTTRAGYYALEHGASRASLKVSTNNLPSNRSDHSSVSSKGQLWLIGGESAHGYQHDVWRSNDGVDWRLGQHGTFSFR